MTAPIHRRTRDTFLWVLAVPLLLGALSLWSAYRYRTSISWTMHTQNVLLALRDLVVTLGDAGNSQRAYLLTGDEHYLKNYARASGQLSGELASLRSLTADNPRQQGNLDALTQAVHSHSEKMEEILALRGRGHVLGPEDLTRISEETGLMQSIRNLCESIRTEENHLLRDRMQRQRRFEIEVAVTFVLGIAVTMLLLYFAWQLINEYAGGRDRAEAEIRDLNDDLQKRIDERTAELQETNERLSRSNRDLTQFAYVASHDLQEPLRTVGSYAGLLGRRYEGKLDEQADKYIRFIVDGAKRMQTLVQDLLSYSRVGTQAFTFELTDLGSILQQTRENLRLIIAEKNASVTSDPLPAAICDRVKLLQVFQNLIANAIKFRKPDEAPHIHVGVKLEKLEYVMTVSDNGIGFDPKYAERIFVIFQRLHQVGAYPGNGIGLAICQRVIEAHDGRIWAESEPGVGSRFFFTLPATLKPRRSFSGEANGTVPHRAAQHQSEDHEQTNADTASGR